MNINISGHHLEITDALKLKVEENVNAKLKHFVKLKITSIDATLSVDNYQHKAEATLHIAGLHQPIIAHSVTKDMYTSIAKMSEILEQQLQKAKDKIQDHSDSDLL